MTELPAEESYWVEAPQVVAVYWDSHFLNTPTDVDVFDEFLRVLFQSSWMTGLGEYGIGPARLLGSFVPRDPAPPTLSRAALEERLVSWLTRDWIWPKPRKGERSLLYLVLTPAGTDLDLAAEMPSRRHRFGYHDVTSFEPRSKSARGAGSERNLFYAVAPLAKTQSDILDAHSLAISHGLAEALIARSRQSASARRHRA